MQQNNMQQFIYDDDDSSSSSEYYDSSEEWSEWSDIETDSDSGYESSLSIPSPEYSDLDN